MARRSPPRKVTYFYLLTTRRPPTSTLSPYTTLFRSSISAHSAGHGTTRHLGKKRCPPRCLGVAFKSHCRQRPLLHRPTRRTNHPARHYTITALPFSEVP